VRFVPGLWVLEFPELSVNPAYPQAITLCHYPLEEWDRKHYGAWCLHGHQHQGERQRGLALNVGVDFWNYAPVSLEMVAETLRREEPGR
jgi:calcineurin-like phosphoesterase family protein